MFRFFMLAISLFEGAMALLLAFTALLGWAGQIPTSDHSETMYLGLGIFAAIGGVGCFLIFLSEREDSKD